MADDLRPAAQTTLPPDDSEEYGDLLKIEKKLGVGKSDLALALGALLRVDPSHTKLELIQAGARYTRWLATQRKPKSVTVIKLKSFLGALKIKPGCQNKESLIERIALLFTANADDALENLRRKKNTKIDQQIQENLSRGKNPLEDGKDDAYFDGVECGVLAERQEVMRAAKERFADASEGLTPAISEQSVE